MNRCLGGDLPTPLDIVGQTDLWGEEYASMNALSAQRQTSPTT